MTDYVPAIGDLGIVTTRGFLARAIQFGTLSRWNHAFIYVGNGLIIEATPKGIILNPLSDYDHIDIVWNKHQPWNDEEASRNFIVSEAHRLLNLPYNWTNIVRIVFRVLGLKVLANTKLMERLAQKDGYICSEMVAELYAKSGNSLLAKDPAVTSPGDLIGVLIYQ